MELRNPGPLQLPVLFVSLQQTSTLPIVKCVWKAVNNNVFKCLPPHLLRNWLNVLLRLLRPRLHHRENVKKNTLETNVELQKEVVTEARPMGATSIPSCVLWPGRRGDRGSGSRVYVGVPRAKTTLPGQPTVHAIPMTTADMAVKGFFSPGSVSLHEEREK